MSSTEPGQTLAETTHDRLRKMIVSGELPAGTRLQEKPFADRLGVSRTPVREAIARLVSEGLVTRSLGGVPVVNQISISEIIEILHVRRLLECEAARQAASVNSPVEPLLALRARTQAALEGARPGPGEHAELDEELHTTIARIAGSKLLTELVQSMKLKTRIFDKGFIPDRFEPGLHEHLEILDAILARDADRAGAAMRRHLDNVREAILTHIHRLY
ncbi:GntR family transcriptional regulator [Stappia sp. ES.058]|uniref:GntR family transcriptional regulator n=1 Tax=Stappia sp. ES.058 TaxID=1881061 RepID=UPI00087D49A7|nr:GntR family transcriptional regulator [Stappia sp. ES.058]SDU03227.1 DNA-binding transcriptional regulator, GntR family [Stappia sp. ES.058]